MLCNILGRLYAPFSEMVATSSTRSKSLDLYESNLHEIRLRKVPNPSTPGSNYPFLHYAHSFVQSIHATAGAAPV